MAQFSPAALHRTPSALMRSPNAGSPGHRWDSPQPAAMTRLCLWALAIRPANMVYGRRPAAVRQALVWSSSAFAAGELPGSGGGLGAGLAGPVDLAGLAVGPGLDAAVDGDGESAGADGSVEAELDELT